MDFLKRLWNDEEGQGLVEYGVLLLVVIVIVIGVRVLFGEAISDLFDNVKDRIADAPGEVNPAPGE